MQISKQQHDLFEIEKLFNQAVTLDEKANAINSINKTFAKSFMLNDFNFVEPMVQFLKRLASVYILEESKFKKDSNYNEYSKLFQFTISYWNDIATWLTIKDTYEYPTFRMNIESIRYYEDTVLVYSDKIQKYRNYIAKLLTHDKKIIQEFENNPITQKYLAEAKAKENELIQKAISQTMYRN
jgi:hypothetical protein